MTDAGARITAERSITNAAGCSAIRMPATAMMAPRLSNTILSMVCLLESARRWSVHERAQVTLPVARHTQELLGHGNGLVLRFHVQDREADGAVICLGRRVAHREFALTRANARAQ